MFFIARKSENSVLDQIKYLQIQDRTLVDLKHLMKYHPVPLCSVDTQQYQDPSSHSASFYNLALPKVSPVLFWSLCVALPHWTGRCLSLRAFVSNNNVKAVVQPVPLWRVRGKIHEPSGWCFQHAAGDEKMSFGVSQAGFCNIPWLLNSADMMGVDASIRYRWERRS